ncbi:MAG: TonB-dependent receptor plug domain-containing protein [Muribaculaceae bacterium]|nr:TonB-dependent receptor plug domain-containing protein [Muribaculaceae bacterium]
MKLPPIFILIVLCYFSLPLTAQTELDSVSVNELREVVVTEFSASSRINSHLGSEVLELNQLSLTPQMFGEVDILKSITLLPGVRNEAEGAGGFEVRGGNAYQNLVLMDGMTLYNPSHLMGVFSTFNEDAMSRAVLHKGPIPATLGGASSSALETYMKPGSLNNFNFSGTVGILNAKVAADGPIIKDKLSFAVSARRSYVDLLLKLIPQYKSTVMNFYDINAKIRYKVDSSNTIDLSFFNSRDNLAVSKLMEMRWGNLAGSLNWFLNNDNLLLTSTASVTNYTTDMGMSIMDANQKLKEYIRSYSLNEKFDIEFSENQKLDFGFRSELFQVKSADMIIRETHQKEMRSGWQNAVWVRYEGSFFSKLYIEAGLRGSLFSALSQSRFHYFLAQNEIPPEFSSKNYFNLEPRGSIRFQINDCHNIKAGISVSTQNLHGVRSTFTTFPFDRYALTSSFVKPESTTQYSLGYAGMSTSGGWDWSVETYWKDMKNVYDYKDGVTMFSRISLESLILSGVGRSYGLELMLRKNLGKLTGWVSYTLSKTETKIPGINNGDWYKASNDHRNDLTVVGLYEFNKNWNLSLSWSYSSGRPLTAPDAKYQVGGTTCYFYSERNSYQTPSSHHLDISARYIKIGKRFTSILSFGVYNVYSHQSPFVIYFEDDPTKPSGTRAVQQSLFPILPSVSYTLKF